MTILVTGASGHVGVNLVRALASRGRPVRALIHAGTLPLDGFSAETVNGDILAPDSLDRAMAGADTVYHLAARISIVPTRAMKTVNVAGTRNVVDACLRNGVKRLVHFSSIHAVSHAAAGSTVDESCQLVEYSDSDCSTYDRSKAAAEGEVRRGTALGLNAVIIRPTAILGPHDHEPSLFGEVLLSLARGEMPGLVAGGFDWVDVRDVVQGAIRAEEIAAPGSEYLLSGHWATLKEVAAIVGSTMRRGVPGFICPMWLASLGAPLATAIDRIKGRRSLFTSVSIKTLRTSQHVSHEKAARELGYEPRPLRRSIEETLQWFVEEGRLGHFGRGFKGAQMSEATFYRWLVLAALLMAVVVFTSLFFVAAPYGRHARAGWGPSLSDRLGWIVMESVAPAAFFICYLSGPGRDSVTAIVFLAMWELHYVHRAFVFPFSLRNDAGRITLAVVGLGFLFNCMNAYLNGRYVFTFSGGYPTAWLTGPQFITGAALFAIGYVVNRQADLTLRSLRRPGESGYSIPSGGLYRWISCPNYFGEILIWTGWAVATWSLAGLVFAVWTAANLVPRARSHQRWYRDRFPDYPAKRKALIPLVW